MGSLIAGAAATGCTWICCGACNQCSEAKTGAMSRLPYLFLFFLASIFAILMSLYGETEFGFKFYHTHICQSEECAGNGSVFRVSFCLFLFELIHVLIICKAPAFHHLFFPFKFLGFIAVLVCSFVISDLNAVFDEWGEIARYFSGVYLLLQIVIFVSWSYDLNEYLRVRGDQLFAFNEEQGFTHRCCCECIPGNFYYWSLGILSVFCLLASFVSLGLFYPLYDNNHANPHCAYHEDVTSVTLILAGVTVTISLMRGDGSFGVATMLCLYSTFLLFTAMQADPDDAEPGVPSCNLFHRARNSLSLWMGFLLTLASLFYAAMRSGMIAILGKDPDWHAKQKVDDDDAVDVTVADHDADADGKVQSLLTSDERQTAIAMQASPQDQLHADAVANKSNYDDAAAKNERDPDNPFYNDEEESEEERERKANVYFHVVMMLAAAYMSMLLTNWGTNKDSIDTVGTISFVVGVAASWTAFFVYWWTVLAPKLCPSRFPSDIEE